jgi:hypothetical protein
LGRKPARKEKKNMGKEQVAYAFHLLVCNVYIKVRNKNRPYCRNNSKIKSRPYCRNNSPVDEPMLNGYAQRTVDEPIVNDDAKRTVDEPIVNDVA